MFTLKKVLGKLVFPLPLSVLLCLAGLGCYLRGRRKACGVLCVLACVFIYLPSLPLVSNWALLNLERQYPKYAGQSVTHVVVLGGWNYHVDEIPLSSLLSAVSLARLTEGVMVYAANPGAKLLLSGYGPQGKLSNARAMRQVALAMGVPERDIIIEERPRDTDDEARLIGARLVAKRFALVTSASHMPRAMWLFAQQGARPIAAPTNFRTPVRQQPMRWQHWLPSGHALGNFDVAWHEYVGLIYARLWHHAASSNTREYDDIGV